MNWRDVAVFLLLGFVIGGVATVYIYVKPLEEENAYLRSWNTNVSMKYRKVNHTLEWMEWALTKAIRNCTFNCTD